MRKTPQSDRLAINCFFCETTEQIPFATIANLLLTSARLMANRLFTRKKRTDYKVAAQILLVSSDQRSGWAKRRLMTPQKIVPIKP